MVIAKIWMFIFNHWIFHNPIKKQFFLFFILNRWNTSSWSLNVIQFHILAPVLSGSASPFWGPSGWGWAWGSSGPIISSGWPVLGSACRQEGLWSRCHWHCLRGPVGDLLGGCRLHGNLTWGPLVLAFILDRCFLNSALFLLLSLQAQSKRSHNNDHDNRHCLLNLLFLQWSM